LIIEIATFGRIPKSTLNRLFREIEKTYAPYIEKCFVDPILEMPPLAYSSTRRQYDADVIIDRVFYRITGDHKVLAVLDVDLYTSSSNLNFIFGQAQLGGRVALVSLCRIDPKFYGKPPDQELLLERAVKEAVHEVGHTLGLDHCSSTKCVMCFSNGVSDVDKKGPTPCKRCTKKLQTIFTTLVSR
jgi:archaemetzincin